MRRSKNHLNGNKQSDILVGVALLLLAAVFAYLGFSQPKVSNNYTVDTLETQVYSPDFDVKSATTESESQVYTETDDNNSSVNSQASEINVSFPINLNSCTKEELMAIDGIGEARAEAIIAYREQLGGYTSIEQLKEISGIGDALYEQIAPYVTI